MYKLSLLKRIKNKKLQVINFFKLNLYFFFENCSILYSDFKLFKQLLFFNNLKFFFLNKKLSKFNLINKLSMFNSFLVIYFLMSNIFEQKKFFEYLNISKTLNFIFFKNKKYISNNFLNIRLIFLYLIYDKCIYTNNYVYIFFKFLNLQNITSNLKFNLNLLLVLICFKKIFMFFNFFINFKKFNI